jgi:hypothetical protein
VSLLEIARPVKVKGSMTSDCTSSLADCQLTQLSLEIAKHFELIDIPQHVIVLEDNEQT